MSKDDFIKPKSFGQIEPKISSHVYEFYISGAITGPEDYIDTFDTIRHAREDDTIKLYINSYGGDLFTAIQFMRVLSDTDALVVCSVEGACMSAATMLFLSADVFEVTPHSIFMFHNYSGGTFGKGGEMFGQLQHERKWSEKLLNEIYEDFMSVTEITSILDNKDIWMDVDEVIIRMEARIKTRKELAALDEATRPTGD
jgi:ATP-dependent protease ClpP protease subunit